MKQLPKLLQLIYPSIRRRYFYYLRKDTVLKSIAARHGNCEGCGGQCCKRTRVCPYLREGKCSQYGDKMFLMCRIFPVDQQDIILSGVGDVCQYYWDDQKQEGQGVILKS